MKEESALYYFTEEKKIGMTLRDYFAAKAMGIYMADENLIDSYCYLEKDVKKEVAAIAYMMADAMLRAREA